VVIDAGMNTGFYTVLTAALQVPVHALDIQLDCFDVARKLVSANGVQDLVNFHFLGLWSHVKQMNVREGCDPGKGIDNIAERAISKDKEWNHRTHNVTVVPLSLLLERVEEPSMISILKMDIEGAEISALQGLKDCHLKRIQNIIMECAQQRIRRLGNSVEDILDQFERLIQAGFTPYLLYKPLIPPEDWWNETAMTTTWGTHAVSAIHPILQKQVPTENTSSNIVTWKVADWKRLFSTSGACGRGCNLLFTKLA